MQDTTPTQTLIEIGAELARANPTQALWAIVAGAVVYGIYRVEKADNDPELREIREQLDIIKDKTPAEINEQVSLLVKLEMMEFHIQRLENEIEQLKRIA